MFSEVMSKQFPVALSHHLAGRVRATRRRYRKRLARCQEAFSEKAVHDLRVETRRVLALVGLLETLHFKDGLNRLSRLFKKRLDSFDDLRDTQVQLRLLKPLWRQFPEAREFRTQLRQHEQRLITGHAREIKSVGHARPNRKLKELQKVLRKRAGRKGRDSSESLVLSALQAAFDQVVALRANVFRRDVAAIHRMRVAFKRYRYMSELLQPFQPWLTTARCRRMRIYQAMAGEIQDIVVLLERLDHYVREQTVSKVTTRDLRKELLRRKRRAIDSFMTRIDELYDFQPAAGAGQSERTRPIRK